MAENMAVPSGFRFRPLDEELLRDYLGRKCAGESLPCDIVFDREIYGAGDKAPWQLFTKQDPWEICKTLKDHKKDLWKTEGTVYVFTTLIKASEKRKRNVGGKDRFARTAGCGCWHGETAREDILDSEGRKIGYKRMLCFEIMEESGYSLGREVTKGHWIMHEYSLCNDNTMNGKGEYVLCRIKFDDSKNTKKSPKKRKNVEAAAREDDLAFPRPAKHVRTELMQEQRTEFDVAAEAPETTEVVPFLQEEIALQEDWSFEGLSLFTREDFDEVLTYFKEPVSAAEQQESFGFDNDFGNITLINEAVPSSLGLASSVALPCLNGHSPISAQQDTFTISNDPIIEGRLGELDEVFADLDELVSVGEQEGSLGRFDYEYDDFGNISFSSEDDPSSLVLASSVPMPIDSSFISSSLSPFIAHL